MIVIIIIIIIIIIVIILVIINSKRHNFLHRHSHHGYHTAVVTLLLHCHHCANTSCTLPPLLPVRSGCVITQVDGDAIRGIDDLAASFAKIADGADVAMRVYNVANPFNEATALVRFDRRW